MTERDLVASTPFPRTRDSLAADLRRLGLADRDTALVHCSLRAVGWVSGGAAAVIGALRDVVGEGGTLVMPAQSTQLTDPARWRDPAIPEGWHGTVRATMPAYDPATTPTRGMGAVAEAFRTDPRARRSAHPALSFAAVGPRAAAVTAHQRLDDPFGEDGPLGVLCALGARVLLLGVGFERCTALHLAERRAWPDRPRVRDGSPLLVDGARAWVAYTLPVYDDGPLAHAGAVLAERGIGRTGPVGSAACHLLPMADLVTAMAAHWSAAAPEPPPAHSVARTS